MLERLIDFVMDTRHKRVRRYDPAYMELEEASQAEIPNEAMARVVDRYRQKPYAYDLYLKAQIMLASKKHLFS